MNAKTYKAVFDYKKINQGFCVYIMINIVKEDYSNPEKIAKELAKDTRIESINICTGDYELLLKLRTKDIDEYYEFTKKIVKEFGFVKLVSITSLKQAKAEFVEQ